MELTEQQRSLMEHTVSEPNRNWFGTGLDCADSKIFEGLVDQGLATSEEAPIWMGDGVIYRLTKKGKQSLIGGD